MTRTTSPESILARLKNLRRERYPNIPPNAMLQLYAQQGFLARLDASRYGDNCVLKGAMSLFTRYGNAALVEIGEATTRMKDLYDLHVILGREEFGAELVSQALERSFAARGTPRARVADILGDDFAQDEVLNTRWKQYLSRNRFRAPSFPEVMSELQAFYGPLLLGSQRTGRWREGKWLDR